MLQKGSVVVSTKGHDKGRLFVVACIEGDFAWLIDGTYRKWENLKKKRIKHIQLAKQNFEGNVETAKDFEVATFLKNLGKLHK